MNRIGITVTARRRPQCLARCLRAIDISTVAWTGEALLPSVSIDESPLLEETVAVEREAKDQLPCYCVRVNQPAFGIWTRENNAYMTYKWALERPSCYDSILAVEDDCLLSPDALWLCSWFLSLPNCSDYLFLNLANCNQPAACLGRELDVVESNRIESPWAWCFTRAAWELQIKPQWNHLTGEGGTPKGWDWSLSASMASHGWKSLMPVLPRARNIGRELGENGGAEIYDKTLALAACSDGTWGDEFRLVK